MTYRDAYSIEMFDARTFIVREGYENFFPGYGGRERFRLVGEGFSRLFQALGLELASYPERDMLIDGDKDRPAYVTLDEQEFDVISISGADAYNDYHRGRDNWTHVHRLEAELIPGGVNIRVTTSSTDDDGIKHEWVDEITYFGHMGIGWLTENPVHPGDHNDISG